MGPRQAIDVPRDSITIQTRPWPTSNGAYIAKFRGIWNLRAMAMKQLKSQSEPEDIVTVSLYISYTYRPICLHAIFTLRGFTKKFKLGLD